MSKKKIKKVKIKQHTLYMLCVELDKLIFTFKSGAALSYEAIHVLEKALRKSYLEGREKGLEEAEKAVKKHVYSDEPVEAVICDLAVTAIRSLANEKEKQK